MLLGPWINHVPVAPAVVTIKVTMADVLAALCVFWVDSNSLTTTRTRDDVSADFSTAALLLQRCVPQQRANLGCSHGVDGLGTLGFSAQDLRGIDRENALRILPKYR